MVQQAHSSCIWAIYPLAFACLVHTFDKGELLAEDTVLVAEVADLACILDKVEHLVGDTAAVAEVADSAAIPDIADFPKRVMSLVAMAAYVLRPYCFSYDLSFIVFYSRCLA